MKLAEYIDRKKKIRQEKETHQTVSQNNLEISYIDESKDD